MSPIPVLAFLMAIVLTTNAAVHHVQLNGQNTATVVTGDHVCCDKTTREITFQVSATTENSKQVFCGATLYDKRSTRTNFGSAFDRRMIELDKHAGDHKGHILASVLGGPAEIWNLAPQADNVNKKIRARTSILNTWYNCEKWVQTQLEEKLHLPIRIRLTLTYSTAGGCRPTHWSISAANTHNEGCEAGDIPNGVDSHFGVCQRPGGSSAGGSGGGK